MICLSEKKYKIHLKELIWKVFLKDSIIWRQILYLGVFYLKNNFIKYIMIDFIYFYLSFVVPRRNVICMYVFK